MILSVVMFFILSPLFMCAVPSWQVHVGAVGGLGVVAAAVQYVHSVYDMSTSQDLDFWKKQKGDIRLCAKEYLFLKNNGIGEQDAYVLCDYLNRDNTFVNLLTCNTTFTIKSNTEGSEHQQYVEIHGPQQSTYPWRNHDMFSEVVLILNKYKLLKSQNTEYQVKDVKTAMDRLREQYGEHSLSLVALSQWVGRTCHYKSDNVTRFLMTWATLCSAYGVYCLVKSGVR